MAKGNPLYKSQESMDEQFKREYAEVVTRKRSIQQFLEDWSMTEQELNTLLDERPDLLEQAKDITPDGEEIGESTPEVDEEVDEEVINLGDLNLL